MASMVEVHGLQELIDRMKAYPGELRKSLSLTVTSALIVLWENVPAYPPPPEDSTYKRTGTLGKSLGSGLSGGAVGEPDVFTIKALGSGYEGKFGSNLSYAPYVIGEQQSPRMSHWWTIKAVAEKSADKIMRLFETLAEKMAGFLEGKG